MIVKGGHEEGSLISTGIPGVHPSAAAPKPKASNKGPGRKSRGLRAALGELKDVGGRLLFKEHRSQHWGKPSPGSSKAT